MAWFRLDEHIPENKKVQKLPCELFKLWINLLCISKATGGILSDINDAAWRLRVPPTRLVANIERLVTSRLIDKDESGTYSMHDWQDWQYESDNSTPRVAKYRNARKAAGLPLNGWVKHKQVVFDRDGHRCVYCGSGDSPCIDHVIPVPLGGDDDPINLATACKPCNSGKSGRDPIAARMSFTPGCAYASLYAANISRLFGSDTVSQNESDTVEHSVSVSVSENKENSTKVSQFDPPFSALESVDDWFEMFFEGYWRKKSKEAARKAFYKHVKNRDMFNQLIAARDAQHPEMMRREPTHRPHAASWLNGERWNDEVETANTEPQKTGIHKLLESDTENV